MYLAQKDGEYTGRIAAIINDNHNKFHEDKVGFFGFFECINDVEIAKELFNAASDYLRENGMESIRGPVNPSTNDECGLLIEGYDRPAVMLMTYCPPYYKALIENCGFDKAKDLHAYEIDSDQVRKEGALDKLERVSAIVSKKENISIRKLNMKDFDNELQRVRDVYNSAWEKNWGFVPMTEEEFSYIAKTLKLVVNTDLIFFAEQNGVPIGFSLSIPDFNQVFIKMNGKFFPFGIFKFFANKNKIDGIRVIIMGVKHAYQRKGIDAAFILNTIRNGLRIGVKKCEVSWVLEDNLPMVQTAEKLNAKLYKKYRIFEKKL